MRFTAIFYESDGRITSVQKNATENVVGDRTYIKADFDGDPDDFYVSSGKVISKGEKPSSAHVFDYNTGTWGFDLSTAKHEAWSMIKVARNIEEFGTFTWSSHTFQCDEISQRRIQSAVQLAQLDSTTSVTWTLSDNTTQVFNATELQQIGQALSAHINACHDKARTKRSEINAATTEEQINSVSW